MEKIFLIDMNSLFPTLFWVNIIALLFLFICHSRDDLAKEKRLSKLFIVARICHAVYYFVASGRGILPSILSVNFGNTMLFIGFYFEGKGILKLLRVNSKFTDRFLRSVMIGSIIIFNAVEFAVPLGGIRITMASLGVFLIMALPVFRMFLSRDAGPYVKPSAIFCAVFLIGLLVRAWYGLHNQTMGILTTNIIQSITFLSLLLQVMIALPSYTMIVKNRADAALLLMATTDRLTGATNRHAFLDAAAMVFKNSRRHGVSVSALFLDIDHFKQINDTYGHAFGDAVLARMAALIDKCLRGSDLSCRYGGEEFLMLLPNSDNAAAELVANRITDEVRKARFDEQPDFSFTVSIGVSSGVPASDQAMDAAFKSADEAMYEAKRAGRDRVVISRQK
ncbi:MAG: GGDEF domain-containing protein [Clostridiales bacterium]|nr:GGDEF domain-containing protein [Clostridiales bacterium]